jgi:2-polyprenyl-3-methyl-5-hydroxy-6-metoxy-1,4-benzoquinol methylase
LSKEISCNLCCGNKFSKLFTLKTKSGTFIVVKCVSCGLVFQNPQPTSKEINAMYDKDYFEGKGFDEGVDYVQGAENIKGSKHLVNSRLKVISFFSKTSILKKRLLLDVGSGVGDFLYSVRKNGWDVKGTELSKFACSFSKKKFNLDVFNGTLEGAKYKSDTFDVITFSEVIEHLNNPYLTLKESHKILKKNGLIVIQTGDVDCFYSKLCKEKWPYLLYGHLFYFSKKTLSLMLKKSGFKIVKTFNGDEISVSSYIKYYFAVSKPGFKSLIGLVKLIVMQFLRKLGFGGMTIYAIKT